MKKNSHRAFDNTSGFNLIEAALVLGIAGIVVGGIFAAWGAVSGASRLRHAQDQITVIVNQIRSTYGNRRQLDAGATGAQFTNALINAGILPDTWLENMAGVNQIGNPYGGNIIVAPDSSAGGGGADNDAMTITFSKLDHTDCMKLAGNVLGSGRAEGLIKIDSTAVNSASTFQDVRSSVCNSSTVNFTYLLKSGN